MKSKFFYQDVDVVSLAYKCKVVRCVVNRDYGKVLLETGKLSYKIRVTKNGLVSGVDIMFKSSDFAFKHTTDQLNPLRKSIQKCIRLFYRLQLNKLPSPLGENHVKPEACLGVYLNFIPLGSNDRIFNGIVLN